MKQAETPSGVRLDRWLWAARFFKTRSLAKKAIDTGRVRESGQRCKPGRLVQPGVVLTVQSGFDVREVKILALSGQRRGAAEAATLYQEPRASLDRRLAASEQRRAAASINPGPAGRPDKRWRRQIHRFRRQSPEDG